VRGANDAASRKNNERERRSMEDVKMVMERELAAVEHTAHHSTA
jgi:RNA polymerase-interacting CarD/CdnL/TRCF family regulator